MIETWGKVYWPIYLILCSIGFLVPEIIALLTDWKNTLSNYAWTELNVSPNMSTHTIAWWLSLLAWGLFIVVITVHIWAETPR